MGKFDFGYSTENISLPSQNDFLQRVVEKNQQFLRRMRWKAYFFLNPDATTHSKDTYGFKSIKNPPPIDELKKFEDDMLKIIQSTKLKQVNNPFLNKLKDDIERIKTKPSYSPPLTKQRTFTNLNHQYTTIYWSKISQSPTKKPHPIPHESSIQKTKTLQRN